MNLMKLRNSFKHVALVVLLLTATVDGSAQRSSQTSREDKPLNYGFVSPNVKEGLSLEDAIVGLNSSEEWSLIRSASNLRCVVKTQIRVYPALGTWSDGAEHSTMLQVQT